MPDDDPPMRITRIVLRPRITVRAGARYAGRADVLVARVHHCSEVADRECYIANSLRPRSGWSRRSPWSTDVRPAGRIRRDPGSGTMIPDTIGEGPWSRARTSRSPTI